MSRRLLFPLAALLLAAAVAAQEPAPLPGEPLALRTPFLPAVGMLDLTLADPRPLPAGTWRATLTTTLTNTYSGSRGLEPFFNARPRRGPEPTLEELRGLQPKDSSDGFFYFDGEVHAAKLELRRGVGDGVELELSLGLLDLTGGFTDATVERFHAALGFDSFGRPKAPRNGTLAYLREGESFELYRDGAPGTGLADATLGLKVRLPAPAAYHLALRALAKLPLGDEARLASSGSTDLALQLLASRPLGRADLFGALGLARLGRFGTFDLAAQTRVSISLGYERCLGPRTSWVAQLTVAQSPFRQLDLRELDRESYVVDLGLRRRLGGALLFVALSDNFLTFQSSADLGLHLGVSRGF